MGRAVVRLLQAKEKELRERYGIEWRATGVASRRMGWIARPEGLEAEEILALANRASGEKQGGAVPKVRDAAVQGGRSNPEASGVPLQAPTPQTKDVREWIAAARADVLMEMTPLNRVDGQPAVEHIRAALEAGAHAISANKGPVVFAHEELRKLAQEKGKKFLFESAVMDGTPIFSLFRETLPLAELRGFRGILNSTTNVVLAGMEVGLPLEEAVKRAQELGVAETDPSDDLDGWDAAVKVAALAIVLMGAKVRIEEIEREGIRRLDPAAVREARAAGTPYKLVCRAERAGGRVRASVRPERVPLGDPLAAVNGTSSCVHFHLDFLPGLTIVEHAPGVEATAYGMVADFIHAVGKEV